MTTARAKWLMEELAKEAEARLKGDFTTGYTYEPEPKKKFHITKVIFNEPATIVYFSDGSKTVVKCGENDIFDPEKGLAMAITKRCMGNTGRYFNTIKEWTEPWYEENEKKFTNEAIDWPSSILINGLVNANDAIDKLRAAFDTAQKVTKTCGTCRYQLENFCGEPCVDCAIDRYTMQPSYWEPKE